MTISYQTALFNASEYEKMAQLALQLLEYLAEKNNQKIMYTYELGICGLGTSGLGARTKSCYNMQPCFCTIEVTFNYFRGKDRKIVWDCYNPNIKIVKS